MSDPERFLTRWSRRKRDAAAGVASERPDRSAGEPAPELAAERNEDARSPADRKPEASEPFDLAKLPPIDSITSETDIRGFLMPGVPAALRQAALRRAWAADPAIRDFVGLDDYDWDFNAPGIPGFDLSPPSGDVKKMVAEIFGERPADGSAGSADAKHPDDAAQQSESKADPVIASRCVVNEPSASGTRPEPGEHQEDSADPTQLAEHRSDDTASQQLDAPQNANESVPGRSRGRAVPR